MAWTQPAISPTTIEKDQPEPFASSMGTIDRDGTTTTAAAKTIATDLGLAVEDGVDVVSTILVTHQGRTAEVGKRNVVVDTMMGYRGSPIIGRVDHNSNYLNRMEDGRETLEEEEVEEGFGITVVRVKE